MGSLVGSWGQLGAAAGMDMDPDEKMAYRPPFIIPSAVHHCAYQHQ